MYGDERRDTNSAGLLMDKIQPNLMTEGQVSEFLAVSKAALRRWRRENRGPAYLKIERVIRYDPDAVKGFLQRRSLNNETRSTGKFMNKKKAADSRSAARRQLRNAHATTPTK
jgi:hypothetical protein